MGKFAGSQQNLAVECLLLPGRQEHPGRQEPLNCQHSRKPPPLRRKSAEVSHNLNEDLPGEKKN